MHLQAKPVLILGLLAGCGASGKNPQRPARAPNKEPVAAVRIKTPNTWLTEYLVRTGGFYVADAHAECSEWAVDLQNSKGAIYKRWTTADGRQRHEEERKIGLVPGHEFISNASSSRTYQRPQLGDAWELEKDDWGVDGCAGTSGLWEKKIGSHYRIANYDVFMSRTACEAFIQRSRYMGCLWTPLTGAPPIAPRSEQVNERK